MNVSWPACIAHGDVTSRVVWGFLGILFPTDRSSVVVNDGKQFNLIMSHRAVLWEYYYSHGSYPVRKLPLSLSPTLPPFILSSLHPSLLPSSLVYCSLAHTLFLSSLCYPLTTLIPQPSEDALWLFIKPAVCVSPGGQIPLDSISHYDATVLSSKRQISAVQKKTYLSFTLSTCLWVFPHIITDVSPMLSISTSSEQVATEKEFRYECS